MPPRTAVSFLFSVCFPFKSGIILIYFFVYNTEFILFNVSQCDLVCFRVRCFAVDFDFSFPLGFVLSHQIRFLISRIYKERTTWRRDFGLRFVILISVAYHVIVKFCVLNYTEIIGNKQFVI